MGDAKNHAETPLGKSFAAVVLRECESLLHGMTMKKRRHKGVHRARKSCRKLRSMLAFVVPYAADQAVDIDDALKRLQHEFSDLRDAHVAQRTARLLASSQQATLTPTLQKTLENHAEELLRCTLEDDPDWRRKHSRATQLSSRLQQLPWTRITPSRIKKVIGQHTLRAKKARDKALEHRTPEALHRWRKRARKLRYQLELASTARTLAGMKKARSRRYDKRAKKLSLITDRLGWRQDFQMFLDILDQLADTSVDAAALSHALKRKSTKASAQSDLLAEKPKGGHAYVAKISRVKARAKQPAKASPVFGARDHVDG